jgi:hypothetical protein
MQNLDRLACLTGSLAKYVTPRVEIEVCWYVYCETRPQHYC